MDMGFEKYVPKFDLKNHELSSLLSGTAIALDNHLCGRASMDEYNEIEHTAKLILGESRIFREGSSFLPFDGLFFWEFYGRQEEKVKESERANADRLVTLSEDLKSIKSLPKERVEALRGTMMNLSKATMNYWSQHNPNGFRR